METGKNYVRGTTKSKYRGIQQRRQLSVRCLPGQYPSQLDACHILKNTRALLFVLLGHSHRIIVSKPAPYRRVMWQPKHDFLASGRQLGERRDKPAIMLVGPRKAGVFSEEESHQGKSQSPVAWIARRKETES